MYVLLRFLSFLGFLSFFYFFKFKKTQNKQKDSIKHTHYFGFYEMLDIYELPLCNFLISHHIEAIFMKGMHLNRVLTSITTVDHFFVEI